MKKILFILSIFSVLLLSACGIKSLKVTDDGVDIKTDDGGSLNVTDDGVKGKVPGKGSIDVNDNGVELNKDDSNVDSGNLDDDEKESLKVINDILDDK